MSYTKMKPARKKELVKALRKPADEGGYFQGREKLVSLLFPGDWVCLGDDERIVTEEEHQFCCLGVATDLMVQKGLTTWDALVVEANVNDWRESYTPFTQALEELSFPSEDVLSYFGISHKAAVRLAGMNDEGESFEQIADWIERNL